ncbi:membrane protein [Microtetraspora sp. NBRC 13810]|uniref:alpha/beta hydrolase n=1 Tax=Microtetraspora sp. NBRC 13810 TaxID=3030990 RepID=UPI0024A189F3|nr:alpha/beta-hydrolase family protein [Microtetraspora sp. NBRC 13810]GLW05155.1 membrane protein [Microtetraspora sp. NBRC 13810]
MQDRVEDRTAERAGTPPTGDGSSRVVRRRLDIAGTLVAVGFFCASLSPSLLPRSWFLQGVVAGVTAAAGYGLGGTISALVRRFTRLVPSPRAGAFAWRLLLVAGTALCVLVLYYSSEWQREVRRTMAMDTDISWYQPVIAVIALATFAVLVALSRSIRLGTRKLISLLGRFIPRMVAKVVGLVVAVLLVSLFANDVVFANFIEGMNNTSSLVNGGTDLGVTRPRSPFLAGGPGSLVPWETLGREGRDFTGRAPTRTELSAFAGKPAMDPVRVYVGLQSATSYDGQARLAVRELERTGAFRRQVLVVMGTTGTGWVDANIADALEYMYAGNSALVAMQYSYLPSWLSFVVDRTKAAQAAVALVRAVEAKLATLPADSRPKFLVAGESLGSYAMEEAFGTLDALLARTDGALLVGPPNADPIWRRVTERRDPGTPMWRPVYQGGSEVLFGQFPADFTPFARAHVVYLQNASDPVVWWSPDLLWRKPGWLEAPRGPDVAPAMRWYPVVTFWQVVVDLAFANYVPPGHGHQYGVNVVNGWAAVAPPPGWTGADTDRLRKTLAP